MAAGPFVERRGGLSSQGLGQEFVIRRRHRVGTNIGRGLGAFMWRLGFPEPVLHVDPSDGIVHAVLDVSGVTHFVLPQSG
jgi:hypothetical protein